MEVNAKTWMAQNKQPPVAMNDVLVYVCSMPPGGVSGSVSIVPEALNIHKLLQHNCHTRGLYWQYSIATLVLFY